MNIFRTLIISSFYVVCMLPVYGQNPLWEKVESDISAITTVGPSTVFKVTPPAMPKASRAVAATVPASVADEIKELAKALGNDPVRIFNHVRNHIDYECYHGMRKGAVLTLLEGSGNDFDQCVLLAELLKAAGFTDFQYRHRGMKLAYGDLIPWLGLASDAYPGKTFQDVVGKTIVEHFGNDSELGHQGVGEDVAKRAIHSSVFFQTHSCRSQVGHAAIWAPHFPEKATVVVDRLYLTLRVHGNSYDLDPAYKMYEDIPGVGSLLQGMGYNSATLLAAVGGGSDANYSLNVNFSALNTNLNTYTSNLLNALRTQYPDCTLDEIVSGRRIVPLHITSLADAFPLPKDFWGTDLTWTQIPTTHQSMFTMQIGSMIYTTPISALEGRKISLTFSGNTVQVRLDDSAPVASTSVSTATFDLTMTVKHPGQDQPQTGSATYKKNNNFSYAILYGFNTGIRLLQKRNDILRSMLDEGKLDSSHEVRTELLNIMGLTWLQQTQFVRRLLARQNGVIFTNQHRVGRMAQEQGFYIDVGQQLTSYITRNGISDDGADDAFFQLGGMFYSAMEHGIIEQMQDGFQAVSTVNILRKANDAGQWIYKADSTNWFTTVKTGLKNYTDEQKKDLENEIKEGATILLPKNANVSYGKWKGSGWVINKPTGIGMIISGNYSGGYATNYGYVSSPSISYGATYSPSLTYAPPISGNSAFVPPNFSIPRFYGSDPVNMATGAFEYSHTDIETGVESAPRGLAFSRDYTSSSQDKNNQNLGYGWTHSLHMRAALRTAAEETLGNGSPEQTAALLVATMVGADLYRKDGSVREWSSAALAVSWFQDWMLNNAVSITLGNQNFQFIKQPGGSYQPPAGSTMSLSLVAGKYRLAQRHGNIIQFQNTPSSADKTQCVEKIIDPDGKEMTFTYHSDDRINYVQDAYSRRYTLGYTGALITSITETPAVNGTSRTVSFLHDTHKNLERATDPEGKNQHYDYAVAGDPSAVLATEHRLVRLRNHDSQTITQNLYDPLGRVKEQWLHGDPAKPWKLRYTGTASTEENPSGGITTYHYDAQGRASGKTDPSGNSEHWTYDGQDRIKTKTTAAGETTAYIYDANHNIKEIHHPRAGGITYHTYDALMRPSTTTDPDGRLVTYNYLSGNTKNRPDSITDPAGSTSYQYKTTGAAAGRLWKETRAGLTTEYEYHATYGHPLWIKEPGGYQTSAVINARGDLTEITDANSVKTTITHNLRRQPRITTANSTASNPVISESTYNNQGLTDSSIAPPHNNNYRNKVRQSYNPTEKPTLTKFIDLDGEGANDPFTEVTYDGRDWQKTAYDIARRSTSYTPFANGLLEKTTLPGSRNLSSTYDAQGRPLTSTTPGNNTAASLTTTHSYGISTAADPGGAGYPKTTVTSPDNLTTTIVTNRSGQTRFLKDRRGNQWETQYDAAGRVWKLHTPLGKTTTHTYNSLGQPDTITEPSLQATSHTYHPTTGRLSKVTDATGVLTIQSYDNSGKVLNQSETRSGQAYTISQTYTPLGQLQSRTDENAQTVSHTYYPSGAKWKTIYPGGTENGTGHVEYTYYPDGKLWQVIDKLSSTTTPRTTSYTYHSDGRLHSVTRPNGTVRSLTYDFAGRPYTLTERDAAGKLLHFAKHEFYPNDALRHRYTLPNAPPANQPAAISLTYNADNQINTYNGQTLTHDADGNLTLMPLSGSNSLHSAAYNSRNQLTSLNGSSFDYDSQGNRKTITRAGITTTLIHDTSGGLSKQLVRSKAGQSTRTVWGLGVLYEVNPDGSVTYHHHDLTGSTIALSDGTGKITERISYSPYGQILSRVSLTGTPHDTPYLFTGFFGNETDASGLIHMRARYYSPLLHRFLNSDPAREGNNWYAYAAGNPFGFVDPSGLGIDSVLDAVQTGLSFLGMLPVVGAVFDVINAGISLARGNYVDAAINFASAVPGIGDLAGAAKIAGVAAGGYKGYSTLSRAGKIVDFSSPGSFTTRQLGNAISSSPIASKAYGSLQKSGFDLNIVNRADGFAGETLSSGTVNINRHYNGSVQAALSTLVHESKHVDLLRNTGNFFGLRGVRSGEYAARAREFFFNHGVRPNAAQRTAIQNQITNLGY